MRILVPWIVGLWLMGVAFFGLRLIPQGTSPFPLLSGSLLVAFVVFFCAFFGYSTDSTADNPSQDALQTEVAEGPQLEPISGTILGPDKRPLEGASVYLRRRPFRNHKKQFELAQVTTNADGRFEFRDVVQPNLEDHSRSVFPLDVIAMKAGLSIRWKKLRNEETDIQIQLKKESVYRGLLKDDGGNPVANAKIKVMNLMSLNTITKINIPRGSTPTANGDSFLDLSKSKAEISTTTDETGKFEIRELPNRVGMILEVDDVRYLPSKIYAASTKESLPDIPAGKWITRKQPQDVKEMVRPKQLVELLPIHSNHSIIKLERGVHLKLRIVDDATGQPIEGAEVSKYQRRFAEEKTKTLTDEQGHAEIFQCEKRSNFLVRVYRPEESSFLDLRTLIDLEKQEYQVEHEIRLKQGAVVTGQVLDSETQAGVEGATLYFATNKKHDPEMRTLPIVDQTTSDADGRFRFIVPEEPGVVRLLRVPTGYRNPPKTETPVVDDPFKRSVKPELQTPIDSLSFAISRRPSIIFQFTDSDGRPVAATAKLRVKFSSQSYIEVPVKSDESGKLNAAAHFRGPQEPQGLHMMIRNAEKKIAAYFITQELDQLAAADSTNIVLRPIASVSGQVVDRDSSSPLAGVSVGLSVSYTSRYGQSVSTYTSDKEGRFQFDDLIPGMQYSVGFNAKDYVSLNSIHNRFKAEPDKHHEVKVALVAAKPSQVDRKSGTKLVAVKAPSVAGLTPEKAYELLEQSFIDDKRDYRQLLQNEKDRSLRTRIVTLRDPTQVYAFEFMTLANANRDKPIEFKSLVWLCKASSVAGTQQKYQHLKSEAAKRILENYPHRREISEFIDSVIYGSASRYDAALKLVESPHLEVRGKATLIAGDILSQKFQDPYDGQPDELRIKAMEHYQTVIDDYGSVPYWHRGTLGKCAQEKMFDLKFLQFGAVAPEIEGLDLQGKPMKLSEYRGQVAVIHYWEGTLNSFGRLKELATTYKNRPLVVLGVTTNSDSAGALDVLKKAGISCRSWHDPQKNIFSKWNRGWPNTHVLGYDGKILYKGDRMTNKSLEDVIHDAVKDAEK